IIKKSILPNFPWPILVPTILLPAKGSGSSQPPQQDGLFQMKISLKTSILSITLNCVPLTELWVMTRWERDVSCLTRPIVEKVLTFLVPVHQQAEDSGLICFRTAILPGNEKI